MKFIKTMKTRAAICSTADRFAERPEDVRAEMEKALADAWATDDPAARELQGLLFPGGKPTVEEFIAVISGFVGDNAN